MARENPAHIRDLARERGVEDQYLRLIDEWEGRLFDLDDAGEPVPADGEKTISVTGLVTYAQCPKRFYWTEIDPLPRRRNPAAVRGSEIHRQIELHQRGEVPFEDFEHDLYDAVEAADEAPGAFAAYRASRFADRRADLVEAAFSVGLENAYQVRGRIDAVYREDDYWELVDFKTGRPSSDPSRIVQLQAYAIAARDVLELPAESRLDVTFAYLGGGLSEATTPADQAWVDEARSRLTQLTDDIERGEFMATPGEWCHGCDFLRFCEPGRRETGA
jgi:hypothetical protein